MSQGITNTGGVSFDGPLMLSGLALAKGSLLKIMENYMNYMCSMYQLLGENASMYSETVALQADSEKNQMLEQNQADLSSGLAEGFASIGAAAATFGAEKFLNKENRAKFEELETKKTNLTKVHSDLLETINNPKPPGSTGESYTRTIVGERGSRTGVTASVANNELMVRDQELIGKVSSSDRDTMEALAAEGDSHSTKKNIREAINRMQHDADQAKAAGNETPEHIANRKKIAKATDAVHERIKRLESEQSDFIQKTRINQERSQMWGEVTKGVTQISGNSARFDYGKQAADDKAKATITGSGAQVVHDISQSLDKASSEAAQQAEGYIRMLKELQANNTSRA